MRKPTGEEADKWLSIAREHGFVGEGGSFKLGRFIVEGSEEDAIIYVQFVTPVPAGIYTEGTVEPKAPPVVFERTSAGEIILPGRWWASMFETLSGQPEVPPDQPTDKSQRRDNTGNGSPLSPDPHTAPPQLAG